MFTADLRWNNIGIIGGNSLLDLLKANTTLSKIDLQGNHVPKEILKAIGKIIKLLQVLWISFQKVHYFTTLRKRNGVGEAGPSENSGDGARPGQLPFCLNKIQKCLFSRASVKLHSS